MPPQSQRSPVVGIRRALEEGRHLAMLVRADEQRTVSWANVALRAGLGRPAQGAVGSLHALIDTWEGQDPLEVALDLAARGEPLRLVRDDGWALLVSHDVVEVRDTAGALTHWLVIGRDVTAEYGEIERQLAAAGHLRRVVTRLEEHVYAGEILPDGRFEHVFSGPLCDVLLGCPVPEGADEESFWRSAIHPDDLAAYDEGMAILLRGEECELRYRIVRPDGELRLLRERSWPYRGPAGELLVDGVVSDVTELERLLAELGEADSMLERIARAADAYVYALEQLPGEEPYTVFRGPGREYLLGGSPPDGVDLEEAWVAAIHPDDRPLWDATIARMRDGDAATTDIEYRLLGLDGYERWVWDRSHASVLEDGRLHYDGIVSDITARKLAEERIAFLAYHDELTGLPNRMHFQESLAAALERAEQGGTALAVLFIDLDDFKTVNDSLGHNTGDELLRMIATRLRAVVPAGDVLARQGGDEFLALLELSEVADSISAATAAEAGANRVHDALDAPFKLSGMEFFGFASVGVSLYPFDAEDGEQLLQHADAAMYRAKRAGRGRTRFYAVEDGDALARLSLVTALRRALEREEFVLHWQPIVDLGDGRIRGAEALVRWNDPQHGLRPPGDFIPICEETGMIEDLGGWVMQEALNQGRAWRDQGLDLTVAFNVSMRQLWRHGFAEQVVEAVGAAGLDPASVYVEITESAAAADPDRTLGVLHDLSAAGVQLALDDFGTGYSSLNRLAEMPVRLLKIDRSFMRGLPGGTSAARVVQLLLQLAAGLGVDALAEGIETPEQLEFLIAHGCGIGQGFHFSRPVPADDLVRLLGDWPLAA